MKTGISIKQEKTVFPTSVKIIYGIEVDFGKLESKLPDDKVVKIRTKLN